MTLRAATLRNPSRLRHAARAVATGTLSSRLLMVSGPVTGNAVCLTFDDGPDPAATPPLLDTLRAHGVKATFFVQGSRAAARPDLVRRMRDEGHDVGHHTWTHGAPDRVSASALAGEVVRTRALLQAEAGIDSRLFRPPHGRLTAAKLLRLWLLRQTVVLWSLDPGDVFQPDAAAFRGWMEAHPPCAGDVILLHDRSTAAAEALPHLITLVRRRHLTFATIGEWLT